MNSYIGPLIFCFTLVLVYLWRKKTGNYDLVSWFFISFGIMIGLGLAITNHFYPHNVETGELIPQFRDTYSRSAFIYVPISFVFLWSVYLGASSFTNAKMKFVIALGKAARFQGDSDSYVMKRYVISAVILFLLSFFGYSLYVSAYGGFIAYLTFSAAIRSGVMDSLPPNPFSFLIAFGGLSFIASYLFYGLLRKKFSYFFLVMLIFSIVFSVYVLFSWLGRIAFLFYFMVFFMSFVLKSYTLAPQMVRLSTFSLFFFVLLFSINTLLGRGAYSGVMQMLSMELIFPISSLLTALDKSDDYRLGLDLFTLPIYWTPQRFWTDYLVSADAVNTFLLFGLFKGQGGHTGAVPADILTLSYLNLGYFGFLVFGFFSGYALSSIDYICRQIRIVEIRKILYCYMVMNLSGLLSIYADPSHIAGRLFPVVGFIVVFYFSKFVMFRFLKNKF